MAAPGLALAGAAAVLSGLSLAFNDTGDWDMPIVAFTSIVPCLCTVPYWTLVTQRPFAGVIFAAAVEGCMKLIGGVVVVAVYGWHASEHGHMDMPYRHPNLLVWVFWGASAVYSALLYVLGRKRFQTMRWPRAESRAVALQDWPAAALAAPPIRVHHGTPTMPTSLPSPAPSATRATARTRAAASTRQPRWRPER
jgi:hypothetical protein